MRFFALIVLIAGLVLSGGAVWYMYGQFKSAETALRDQKPKVIKVPTVKVAVAKERLTYGETLGPDSVRMIDWPKDSVPAGAFTSLEDVVPPDGKLRYTLRRMEKHEPILPQKVSGFGEHATVAALLPPGMLAYTLTVSATNSVAGFVMPGSRIDIILTVNDRYEGLITYFLLQNVEVIAVDQDTDPDRIKAKLAKTVTIGVLPEELKQLTLANNVGQLTVVLRGNNTQEVFAGDSLSRRQLLGEYAPKKEAPKQAPTVTIRKGNSTSTQRVQDAR